MKNLMFYIKFALVLALIGWIAKAWALTPTPTPDSLAQEAINAVTIHQGICPTPKGQVLCMVGYDEAANTYWMLLFDNEGVLYQVVEMKEGAHRVRWTHTELTI